MRGAARCLSVLHHRQAARRGLLKAIAVKKVDRVVVQRIDRITRSIADWGNLVVDEDG
jgi:DNA invertase Pin-like site-specific DNA recombinase